MVDYNPDPCISAAILFDLSPYRGGTTIKVYPPIAEKYVSYVSYVTVNVICRENGFRENDLKYELITGNLW